MTSFDVVIVGAGDNGLVAAAYLAKAGKRVLVAERRDVAGGIATTLEFARGSRHRSDRTCAACCCRESSATCASPTTDSHSIGSIRP